MAKAAGVAVQAAEDAERERKRDAIRQRIAAAKAAQAGAANGEAAAVAGGAEVEAVQENLARQMDLGAHVSADLQHHDGHQVSAAEAEAAAWGGGAFTAPAVLPLPTEEAGKSEGITYKTFDTEAQMAEIVALIDKDLSEPYSIFTYRAPPGPHNQIRPCFSMWNPAFQRHKSALFTPSLPRTAAGLLLCPSQKHR